MIHLGRPREIDRVVLPLFSGFEALAIQVWNESSWSEVFRGDTGAQVRFGFEPVVTDKVRLSLAGSPTARIHEIQVYAADPYVRPFPNLDAGRWQISKEAAGEPTWGPRGREVSYRGWEGGRMIAVRVETAPVFRAGSCQVLFEGYFVHDGPDYDRSPDGQRFLMLREVEETAKTASRLVVVLNWFEELKRLVPKE